MTDSEFSLQAMSILNPLLLLLKLALALLVLRFTLPKLSNLALHLLLLNLLPPLPLQVVSLDQPSLDPVLPKLPLEYLPLLNLHLDSLLPQLRPVEVDPLNPLLRHLVKVDSVSWLEAILLPRFHPVDQLVVEHPHSPVSRTSMLSHPRVRRGDLLDNRLLELVNFRKPRKKRSRKRISEESEVMTTTTMRTTRAVMMWHRWERGNLRQRARRRERVIYGDCSLDDFGLDVYARFTIYPITSLLL